MRGQHAQVVVVDELVAELLGIREPTGRTYSRAELAEIDPRARELMERTGWGYERCVVAIQSRDQVMERARKFAEQMGQQFTVAMQKMAEVVGTMADSLAVLAADLAKHHSVSEAQALDMLRRAYVTEEVELLPPVRMIAQPTRRLVRSCPRHGPLDAGGNCRACARERQRAQSRSQGGGRSQRTYRGKR